jgi:hypothetical protein
MSTGEHRDVMNPWWRDASHPDHPDFVDPRVKGEQEARERAAQPIKVDTSNTVPKPAGWDEDDPGNPYSPAVIAQRREDHEREVRENRERDRAEVEHLNSPEVRGL